MSASRKSSLLATAVALGLIVATTIAIHSRSNKKSADQRERSAGAPNTANTAAAAAADKLRSEMETEEARTAAPLSLAPAPAGSKALVVCLEGSEEAAVAQQWAGESRGAGANVSACPPSFLGSLLSKADHAGAYDSIVVETAGAGVEGAVLGQVVKLLKPGGKVHVASSQGAGGDDAGDALATKKRALTFAGFLKVAPCPEDGRVLSGERPTWEAGASAPVRLSFSKPSAAATVGNGNGSTAAAAPAAAKNGSQNGSQNSSQNGNGSAAGKTWKLALDDDEDDEGSGGGVFGAGGGDEEDDDLVDEDALLESSAPVKRVSEADGDGGCATKRRACKDCSCGRAEMEMSENVPPPLAAVSVGNVDDIVTSACGNCSKGDAFRCGGCPFLGKPAFEKGQEKTIMLADLDAQQDD